MTPRFLENQLGRSLRNLGVDSIDVYYLHNPETQLSEMSRPDFMERIRDAFIYLESAAAKGKIQFLMAWPPGTVSGWKPPHANRCSWAKLSNWPATLPAKRTASGSCSFRSIWR